MLMTEVVGFLGPDQGTEMQRLNRFYYSKGVSRVLTRVTVAGLKLYFTMAETKLSKKD